MDIATSLLQYGLDAKVDGFNEEALKKAVGMSERVAVGRFDAAKVRGPLFELWQFGVFGWVAGCWQLAVSSCSSEQWSPGYACTHRVRRDSRAALNTTLPTCPPATHTLTPASQPTARPAPCPPTYCRPS